MIIQKKNIKNILLYLLLFFSVDTVVFGTNINRTLLYVPRIVGVVFIILLAILYIDKSRKVGKEAIVLVFFLSIIFISAFVNKEDVITVLSRLIAILTAYYLAKHFRINEFVELFLKFMYVISVSAIFLEILYYIAPGIVNALPTITNTAGLSFKTVLLSSIEIGQRGFCRAGGIFWEPGAFAVYLNIALFFSFFLCEKLQYRKIITYIIALLITVSTTGYITLFILLLLFATLGEGFNNNKLNKMIIALSLVAIFSFVVLNNTVLFYSLFGKIINKTSTTQVRVASLVGGFQIAMDRPLFGALASNIRPLMLTYQPTSGGMLTNTISYQFAAYGFPFGIVFSFLSIKFLASCSKKILLTLGMIVFWVVLFISETFFSFLPFIFVFYSLGGNSCESSNN